MTDLGRSEESILNSAPQLPIGNASLLRGVTENFSFHASPEAFIASRVQAWQSQSQDRGDSQPLTKRTPVRAKILNRNVAVISSYRQIQTILGLDAIKSQPEDEIGDSQPPAFLASEAYDELMTQFFPPPNLLLSDGCAHARKRQVWDRRLVDFGTSTAVTERLTESVSAFFENEIPLENEIDLYDVMKSLAWRILLASFLGLSPDSERGQYDKFQALQEDLLRGQFSLMPVSINTGFWQSPRSRGITARKTLQKFITEMLRTSMDHHKQSRRSIDVGRSMADNENAFACFVGASEEKDLPEVRDHLLMMTSSLAAKALASLLTAFFLNLYIFEQDGEKLVDRLNRVPQGGDATNHRMRLLTSIYLETERLSPPIVGIMRRSTRDVVIGGWDKEADTLLPEGWDVWMYFVGAGRDSAVFGSDCETFKPARFDDRGVAEPISFGAGSKSCLGKRFTQAVVLLVAEICLLKNLHMRGSITKPGLKAWLGWDVATPEQWAADIKQLPTQRPAAPVMVEFGKNV